MEIGKPQRVKGSKCLGCNEKLDGVSALNNKSSPKPGDISICNRCGNVAVFGDDLKLRQPTDEEKMEIDNTPEIIVARVSLFKARHEKLRKFH